MNYTIDRVKIQENTLKSKQFFKYFPKEVFGSTIKNDGYSTKDRFYGLNDFKWVQYNSERLFSVLSVDIDNSNDTMMYQDFNLPCPSWIIQTDKGFQYHWALKKPMPLDGFGRFRKMIKDIQNKLVALLDADHYAIGLNRVFRCPLNNRTWFYGYEYSLSDFYDLPTPSNDWFNRVYGKIQKERNLFNQTYCKEHDLKSMKEGDGRNVALFDTLRYWAYDEAKSGTYSEFELSRKAEILNYSFLEPMKEKEVMQIVRQIDYFIEHIYNRGYYMALTPEQRKKVASENGAKSGEKRLRRARDKILAVLQTYESWERKVTVSGLATDSKTNAKTVRAYLKELGYKEVSRKEGWKK
jgi:hypothetical protein